MAELCVATKSFMEILPKTKKKNLLWRLSLLGKAKLESEISDGKNKIPHKFLGRKI